MRVAVTLLGAAGFVSGTAAAAQMATPAAMPLTVGAPAPSMLRIGTKVPLKLSEELTTKGKQLRVGQHFQMETTEPVMVDGHVVIPAGSPATGEITEVRNKGMWGKSGHLTAQVSYVTVNGRQVRMTGTFDDKGTAGGIGAVATSAIIFAPAGFFMTGTSAKVPMGAPVIGFVGEDVPLTFATPAPVPIVVPGSTPVVAAQAAVEPGKPVVIAKPAK